MMTSLNRLDQDGELAESLAAEDIRCGDVIAILDVIYEFPSFLWPGESYVLPPDEPVCVRLRSHHTGKPLKVEAICLPYVLVKAPDGCHKTLDVRRCRLVRLSRAYAQKAWKRFRKARKSRSPGEGA
jgi:hypothetical protein